MEFIPYLDECYEVMHPENFLELFDRYHSSCSRDERGAKNELSLEEEIEFTTELKKLKWNRALFKK